MTTVKRRVARGRLDLAFDAGIVVIGALVGCAALVGLAVDGSVWPMYYALAVPVIMVLNRLPVRVGRHGGMFEFGFEFCVLVFLAYVVDPVTALAVWTVGETLGEVFLKKRWRAKSFNMGIGITSGAVSVLVISSLQPDLVTGGQGLIAAGAGAVAYFVVDYLVTGVSLALEERTSVRIQVAEPGALVALAAFMAIASLGYLAALMMSKLPNWSVALVVVPVGTILVAVRALERGSEQSRRLNILVATSSSMQLDTDETQVLEALLAGARRLLRDPQVVLRSTPPGADEVGVPLTGAADAVWLVGPATDRVGATGDDDYEGLVGLAAVAGNALSRLELSAEITRRASYDTLTGLANRALFLDRLSDATRLHEHGDGRLAVLFCDLDGFKRVNDLAGHLAGDQLLVEVGRRIQASVRAADTVARLGGDEFAVLLQELSDPGEVQRVCQRILGAVREPIHVSTVDATVSVTIGVVIVRTGDSPDALLSRADLAMYYAKAQGKDRFETFRPEMGDERLKRLEMVEDLRHALAARELTLHYQTVQDLQSGQVYGIEALARWTRNGIAVPPDQFIPAAEEGGLIVTLGQLVLELFTADVPILRAAAGRRIAVGFNVSPKQLQLEDFAVEVLTARMSMGDVDLVLEVTERDFVNNDPKTLAAMNLLAAADVRFAVDDFGIGFSSIGYLHRLPVRILKIDKSFLADIERDAKACSLVRSMVVMGNALGLDVVAEGVERPGQLKHLIEHAGATTGQGYLYGRPMPLDEIAAFLASQPVAQETSPYPPDLGQSRLAADHLMAERPAAQEIVPALQ